LTVTSSALSSSAFENLSASSFAFAISSSEIPVAPCIVTFCSTHVDFSFADTCIIPFASISNVTSI